MDNEVECEEAGEGSPRSWCVSMLPVPSKGLTPKEAKRWLHEDLECWIGLLEVGFAAPEKEVREDFGALCVDLNVVTTAALYATRNRQTVSFVLDEPESLDFRAYTESLARILTARRYYEGEDGWAFDEIARGLLERLQASTDRGAEA